MLHYHWKEHEIANVTIQFLVLSQQSSEILGVVWKEEIPPFGSVETNVFKIPQILMLYQPRKTENVLCIHQRWWCLSSF